MNDERDIYVKIYSVERETIVAACDKEVLGLKLEDPQRNISFYIDPAYFKGELKDVESLVEILRNATCANLVGKRVVEAALKAGFIHREAVVEVKNIPIAFFTRV
ncbi:MAG: DUF424 family protein [Desulfurococcaceae archaeon]